MKRLKIEIEGMSCDHCVRAIRDRLASTPGVTVQDVSVGTAVVDIDPAKVTEADLQDAVSDEGYTVDAMTAA